MKIQSIILASMTLFVVSCNSGADKKENTTPNTSQAEASDKFYRGAYDDDIVTAVNGAKVNSAYNEFLSEGAFGGVQVIEASKGVWTIAGYSLANYTFVEGKTGLIAFDAGNNMGMGEAALKLIQEKVNKPVVAIIYSHWHYTGGAKAYAASNPSGKVPIYAHPDVEKNMSDQGGTFLDMQNRRGGMQLGAYLPHEGADAAYGPAEPLFEDPALNKHGHLKVTNPVKHGETINIDGLDFTFYHVVADTRDGLIAHIPSLDVALASTGVTNMLLSMYTLRGDYYRAPDDLIEGIDLLRSLNVATIIPVHGLPLTGERAVSVPLAHRDAYAFVNNQTIRAINQGKGPEQMVAEIQLAPHLANHPDLYPGYVDNEYNIRGQYRGIVGWFGEEIADLHPPTTNELGQTIIDMAGGIDNVIKKAQDASNEKKYNLSVKLFSYVLAVEPDNQKAKQMKADDLRQMAYTTKSGIQTRNFLLTTALHLEGELDMYEQPAFKIFGAATVDKIMASAPGSSIKELEVKIDPAKSSDMEKVIKVTFSDTKQSWAIHIRQGVAEVLEYKDGKVDAGLTLPRKEWASLSMGELTLSEALAHDNVTIDGDEADLKAVLGVFDNISL